MSLTVEELSTIEELTYYPLVVILIVNLVSELIYNFGIKIQCNYSILQSAVSDI